MDLNKLNWIEQKTLGLFVKTNGILSNFMYGGLGHIFMLHRILPERERCQYKYNRDLAITPEYLEEIIIYLKNQNYLFVSLEELFSILSSNIKTKQKTICFTIDDGYKDNLEYGYPIFKKHNIPFTIYITNSFPNHSAILWWYLLEEKIMKNDSVVHNNRKFNCRSEGEKQKLYNLLRNDIKSATKNELQKLAANFFNKEKEESKNELKKIALNWSEIKDLSNQKLVTIGCHTQNHLSLKHLSTNDLQLEIETSKKELEENIDKSVFHFAYPYGGKDDATTREFKFVEKAGFKTAVINHPGNVFSEHQESLMTLPRYPLGNSTSKQKLANYLNGISHFSTNQFTKTIKY